MKTRLPRDRPPTHPGEMLREEFLEPLAMTQTERAQRIRVSYPRVNEIVNGRPVQPHIPTRGESTIGSGDGTVGLIDLARLFPPGR